MVRMTKLGEMEPQQIFRSRFQSTSIRESIIPTRCVVGAYELSPLSAI
ncbi:unnamed protein product [Schistocephalus solidus]|uniref:Uncharacterized protein n=1 Tax=Schistocephalus solidus TaxID=70667 RepID=A0A3P7C7J2_SCHSO|nr:unnamed protein product [Schistocephalus solidus]